MNILIAVDCNNTNESTTLIDRTIALLKNCVKKIWLMHVAEPEPDFIGYEVGPGVVRDSVAKRYHDEHKVLQEMGEYIRSKGVECAALLIQGAIVDVVLAQSEKLHAGILVMGHARNRSVRHLLGGDTCNMVIKKSSIAVLVIPVD